MADWTLKPVSHKPALAMERTRVNMLEDFSEVRSARGKTLGGPFSETYHLSLADAVTAWAFYVARGEHTSFTKLTYHAADSGFDPDDVLDTAGPEETVRFLKAPKWNIGGPEHSIFAVIFQRLPNE